jgi:predicted MPP superfamily phosphohydrolase
MPRIVTRRRLLTGAGAIALSGIGTGGYAYAIEPRQSGVTHYRVAPRNWPSGLKLRIAALADLHASEPVMPEERLHQLVATTNALGADVIVLLGDYVVRRNHRLFKPLPTEAWTTALGGLKAPLGVHAILGNHDWWVDYDVQLEVAGTTFVRHAIERVGIPVYHNETVRLAKGAHRFWLAGLGDQWAFYRPKDIELRPRSFGFLGTDELSGTLAKVTDDAPVILLAHEPDVFPSVPDRVSLTLSGHTHGGQVRLLGYAPLTGSYYGRRYVYGHIVEDDRHLIVSGGLGCSMLPIRLGSPPEIVVVDVG